MSTPAQELEALAGRMRDTGAQLALAIDPEGWRERAESVLVMLAASGRPFTAEDLRDGAGDPPSDGALGAVFLAASRRREIALVGFDRAHRLSRHGSVLRVWRGVLAPADG